MSTDLADLDDVIDPCRRSGGHPVSTATSRSRYRAARSWQTAAVAPFPSLKAKQLLRILEGAPLNYMVHRQKGSHRILRAPGRQQITFAYHGGVTVPPGAVRKVLVKDAGLSEDEALGLLG